MGNQGMGDLHEMSDDETVPVKVRADIKRWMVEMVYGKAADSFKATVLPNFLFIFATVKIGSLIFITSSLCLL